VGGATWSTIDAGDWSDNITGSPGMDHILGGQGDDGIYGWDGNDDIDGGDGHDHIVGGHGFDDLTGGAGVGSDHCYDYANSALHGADITDCVAHLSPLTPDGIVLG
jgi:RTX calcium-binding nonapeptide repeat (4 copies)